MPDSPGNVPRDPLRRRLTRETWDAMLEYWRARPAASPTEVGKAVGVDYRTAKKAYEVGLGYDFASEPIRKTLEDERLLARAALAAGGLGAQPTEAPKPGRPPRPTTKTSAAVAARAVRADATEQAEQALTDLVAESDTVEGRARADAITARVAEARLVRKARANIIGLLEGTAHLIDGARVVAVQVGDFLKKDREAFRKDPELGLRYLHEIAKIARLGVQSGVEVVDMERKLLGDPGDAIDPSNMSIDEALKELQAGADALERAKAKGLTLIQGGRVETPPAPTEEPHPKSGEDRTP